VNKKRNNQILQQKINLQELATPASAYHSSGGSHYPLIGSLLFPESVTKQETGSVVTNEILASQTAALHAKEKEMLLEKEHNLELELDYKNRQLTAHALVWRDTMN
jgi:hypothetical protein